MTADSQWPLQKAVFAALAADPALIALADDGGNPEAARVFDAVPGDPVFPYIVLGEVEAEPFDTKTSNGMAHRIAIHVFSRYAGQKETKEIMAAIVTALDGVAIPVPGHAVVEFRLREAKTTIEKDGMTRHGTQTFLVLTEAL